MTEDKLKQIIADALAAQEARLKKRADEQEARLINHIDAQFVTIAGQLTRHVDARVDQLRADLSARIDGLYDRLDSIAKRLDDDDHERTAMNAQLVRHEGWIGQLAKNTGTKLQPGH